LPPLLTDSSASLGGPSWLQERRDADRATFEDLGLPDSSAEVWRYSPIGDLDLGRFGAARPATGLVRLGEALATVQVGAGRPGVLPEVPEGVSLGQLSSHPEGAALRSSVLSDTADAIAVLNGAQMADGLVIDVARGVRFEAPIVIVHGAEAGASFPRTFVRLAEGAVLSVIELFVGGDDATLSVPVTELSVGDGATLSYGSIQTLAHGSWHLATVAASVGRDATVSQLTAGLGASYDRIRTDVVLRGQGASSVLRSTYLGSDDQIHDLRTLQDHAAPRTTSDLLCKGAVDDVSRSIYTGVIRVRNGAVRSDARQTNHNLVLSPHAHADSVPNLEIEENDVRCSHASTVGPLDEDQRYYLESRGILPEVAERLLVRGFFRDLLERSPLPGASGFVRDEIEERLR
jgi:Fe-S cluster assembly protein SufD